MCVCVLREHCHYNFAYGIYVHGICIISIIFRCVLSLSIYIYIQHTYYLIPNQDVDSLQCCCAYCVCESTDEYGFRVSICIWSEYVLCIYTIPFYTKGAEPPSLLCLSTERSSHKRNNFQPNKICLVGGWWLQPRSGDSGCWTPVDWKKSQLLSLAAAENINWRQKRSVWV